MSLHHTWLIVLALVTAASSLIARQANNSWLDSLFSNLAAGFLGSYLVILFVERSIKKDQQVRDLKLKRVARARLVSPVKEHIQFLHNWHKACALRAPSILPDSISDIFFSGSEVDMRYLDFTKNAPICVGNKAVNWFVYSEYEVKRFRSDVTRCLDAYAVFLDPDHLELIERTINSSFCLWVPQIPAIAQDPDWYKTIAPCLMIDPSHESTLREHLDLVIRLAESLGDEGKIELSSLLIWHKGAAPLVGDSRVAASIAAACEEHLSRLRDR